MINIYKHNKCLTIIAILLILLGCILSIVATNLILMQPLGVGGYITAESLPAQNINEQSVLSDITELYARTGIKDKVTISSESGFTTDITLFYTSQHYLELSNNRIYSGIYDPTVNKYGAVINKSFAMKLFATYDCLNRTFKYNDTTYYITGLLEDQSIWERRNNRMICVPIVENADIDYLGFLGQSYYINNSNMNQFKNFLNGLSDTTYTFSMLLETSKTYFLIKVFLILPLVLIIAFILRFIYKRIILSIRILKKGVSKRQIIYLTVSGISIIAVAVFVYNFFNQILKNLITLKDYVPTNLIKFKAIMEIIEKIILENTNTFGYLPLQIRTLMHYNRLVYLGLGLFMFGFVIMYVLTKRLRSDINKIEDDA